ncbi:PucR family transcriptional regulator [Halopolyspora algeriensis]|nr:PucR family transcriptional regulator [Halopolyspora algeriensis]
MLLRDLLDDPGLGLTLLAGREQMDRPVRGIYITDLIDPRRYLHGGELVLSGLVWHTGPADSERFAAALADAGVAALVAGTARLGSAPPDLVEACARHRVPMLEVPVSVSFNTLSERVWRAGNPMSPSRRELVDAVAAGADLEQVLAMAATELGTDCWVLSAAGAVVGGRGELPEKSRSALVREFLASGALPGTVRPAAGASGTSFVLWPIGSDAESRLARWFAVLLDAQQYRSTDREAVAADLATAVALLRSRKQEGRQAASRSVQAALHRLLEGSASSSEFAARLDAAGLPVGEPLRVVALDVDGYGELATTLLREIAAATGVASVTAPLDHGALAVFAGDRCGLAGLDRSLHRTMEDLEYGTGELRLTMGVSDISEAVGLRGAIEEARHARNLAAHRSSRCGIAAAAELATHQVLLASATDDLRRSYRQRVLSRLLAYDETHHSDLVLTLRTFLECSGSWSRCAKRLHVHVNTLRYRIRRVEEITGRDLGDFTTRVDFYLALQLHT